MDKKQGLKKTQTNKRWIKENMEYQIKRNHRLKNINY